MSISNFSPKHYKFLFTIDYPFFFIPMLFDLMKWQWSTCLVYINASFHCANTFSRVLLERGHFFILYIMLHLHIRINLYAWNASRTFSHANLYFYCNITFVWWLFLDAKKSLQIKFINALNDIMWIYRSLIV